MARQGPTNGGRADGTHRFLADCRALTRAALVCAGLAGAILVGALSVVPVGCSTDGRGGTAERQPLVLEDAGPGAGGTSGAEASGPSSAAPSPGPSVPAPRQLPTPPTAEPSIRVRIGTVPGASPVLFDHPQRYVWLSQPGTSMSATAVAPIEVRAAGGRWVIQGAAPGTGVAGTAPAFDAGRPLEVHPLADAEQCVMWSGNRWPGYLVLQPVKGEHDVVAHVPMEQYIPGVLAKELLPGWDIHAYRAQAIAARSYALVEMDRWSGRRHYDVVAGERNQAWAGATTRPQAVQASADTRGQVLTYGGKVVPAYYSSCCGGRGANAADGITGNPHHDIVPLRGGDRRTGGGPCCEGAKVRDWTATLDDTQLRDAIVAWGRREGMPAAAKLGRPVDISVASANGAGRPVSFRVTDGAGASVVIAAEDLRRALNEVAGGRSFRSGDFAATVTASGRGGRAFSFRGTGFGHGCGMCQYGAQAMAKSGRSDREILVRYYPEAEVISAW